MSNTSGLTREKVVSKYGEKNLCNSELTMSQIAFHCQKLKPEYFPENHKHHIHLEKGERYVITWTDQKLRR